MITKKQSGKTLNNQFAEYFCGLKNTLSNIEGKITFMANGGNWGDGLIREGTLKLFRDIDLEYKEIPHNLNPQLSKDTTFIFGGGGAWCKQWTKGPTIIHNTHRKCKELIVLPSTYFIHTPYYDDVTYWARDSLTSLKINPAAYTCPDMALYLNPIRKPTNGIGIGNKYRTDAESISVTNLPECNDDISLKGTHMTPVIEFLNNLAEFREIRTDRLHVAIAAGHILNIPTILKKSNYSKIPDIYHTWLKNISAITFNE